MYESDPLGKAPNQLGAKLDGGENRLGLVLGDFARALQAVGEVGTFGAAKYSDGGWKEVPNGVERYTDALYRHLLAEAAGEQLDADSGLSHAAHVAWNALARLDFILRQQEEATQSQSITRQELDQIAVNLGLKKSFNEKSETRRFSRLRFPG